MTTPTTHDWIARWQGLGYLDLEVADLLHRDVAANAPAVATGVPTSGVPTSGVSASGVSVSGSGDDLGARMLAAAATGLKEAMGYVGAAVTVGTLFILSNVDTWPTAALVGLFSILAVLGAAGLVLLTPAAHGPRSRLAGVSGTMSVIGLTGAIIVTFGGSDGSPFLLTLPIVALSAALYWRHRQVLLHLTTGASLFTMIMTTSDFGSSGSLSMAATGVFLLVVALGWIAACELGVIGQPWVGTTIAAGAAYGAVVLITELDLFGDWGATIVACLGLAVAFTLVGALTDRLRLTIAGSLGLVIGVPVFCTEVLGLSGTTTAALLLPVGITLLGATLWTTLRDREPTAPQVG